MRTSPRTPVPDGATGQAPASPDAFAIRRPRYRPFPLAVILGIVGLAAASLSAFRQAGAWLIVQDPLATSHAIVVLSGSVPSRSREAAQIYQQDFSAQIWISSGLPPARELRRRVSLTSARGFTITGCSWPSASLPMPFTFWKTPTANTEEEVTEIARECRQYGAHRVIMVTSNAHTRRVRFIWHCLFGNVPELVVRYASDDPFDAAHWCRTSSDALGVVREFLGLANAALGFPSRPEPH